MIEVGDKVRIVDIPESFSLKGVGVGSVGEVISLRDNDTSAAVYFEGLSTLVAFTDRDEYLKTVARGWGGAIALVEKVVGGDIEVEEQVFKVGDKVEVVKIHSNVDLEGVNMGAVAEVVDVHSTGKQLLVRFECGSKWWAHFDIKEYEEFSRTVHSNTILVKKVEEPCDDKEGCVDKNIPWFKTPKGIEWLYKNFPEAPKELQTYRHGQVFTVNGHDTPYMLVSCLEEGHHTLVNLRTGLQFSLLPYTEEVTYSDVYEMFGGLNFSLVADSVEECYKEKFNV